MKNKSKTKKPRILELDLFRFVAIWAMFIIHWHYVIMLMGDFFNVHTLSPLFDFVETSYDFWFYSTLHKILRIPIFLFPILCGVTTSFVKPLKAVKKGTKYLAIAYAITLVTFILAQIMQSNDIIIWFGVLHMLASSMLVVGFLGFIVEKIVILLNNRSDEKNVKNKEYCAYVAKIIVFAVFGVSIVLLGYFGNFPRYANNNIFAFLGFYNNNFVSSDYYPLIPWTGWVLIGASLGLLLYKNKKSYFANLHKITFLRPFTTLGQYSIQFYLIHQAVLFTVFGIIFYAFA